jgi:hypothetical protein
MNRIWIAAVLLAVASVSGAQQQNGGLRIVVVEGEDAVNIIQQKTAVRPVVEVRDRNNLPVSGAIVTFSIEGGKAATFGGASTLTVATNAAGQAAVSGLTPSVAGAFQIQVSAAFQGQVATATIAQTNVMTAAQAAAASAASGGGGSSAGGSAGGGGAAGGGGGLSTTTIAIAGAAVAGGAVAATQVGQKSDDNDDFIFSGSFSGTINGTVMSRGGAETCTYVRNVAATGTVKFAASSPGPIFGAFDFTGTDTIVSSTCSSPPPPPQFIGHVDLGGTTSQITGRTSFPVSSTNVTGEHTYLFEGSINQSAATGTFKYEQKSFSPGDGGGSVTQFASGVFTINFQQRQ